MLCYSCRCRFRKGLRLSPMCKSCQHPAICRSSIREHGTRSGIGFRQDHIGWEWDGVWSVGPGKVSGATGGNRLGCGAARRVVSSLPSAGAGKVFPAYLSAAAVFRKCVLCGCCRCGTKQTLKYARVATHMLSLPSSVAHKCVAWCLCCRCSLAPRRPVFTLTHVRKHHRGNHHSAACHLGGRRARGRHLGNPQVGDCRLWRRRCCAPRTIKRGIKKASAAPTCT